MVYYRDGMADEWKWEQISAHLEYISNQNYFPKLKMVNLYGDFSSWRTKEEFMLFKRLATLHGITLRYV